MTLEEISLQDLDRFSEANPYTGFWQTSMMADMQKSKGNQVLCLGAFDQNGHMAGACLIILTPSHFGKLYAHIPRGPLIPWEDKKFVREFFDLLKKDLKKRNVLYASIDPYIPYQIHTMDGEIIEGAGNPEIVEDLKSAGLTHHGFTVGIDLSVEPRWIHTFSLEYPDTDALLSSFERKAVRSIRKAEKYGVEVRSLSREELPAIDAILEQTSSRRGFEWRTGEYNRQLYDSFSTKGQLDFLIASINMETYLKGLQRDLEHEQKDLQMIEQHLKKTVTKKMTAKKEACLERIQSLHKHIQEAESMIAADGKEITVAGGLFFTYGPEILCLMSGYKDGYNTFCAPYAMHWYMMKRGIQEGKKRYNLYGVSGKFDEDEDSGILAFKKGFGGQIEELPGDFDMSVDDFKYSLFKNLKKVKNAISH